ncbi:bifunctional sugar-1-phosphate nucleotidylyltransferase/acetyltransferase [Methanobacterium sp. SMA-27]|uniref:bifunctional sugar-1-phosphate nucleotidylyltransferase/acetyltransferase n=1 Tax=Methanobacterium sp. SMA-27 TaxID=1495336 RepID=UPI00064F555E|nr:bifunctional sugar-1-phosphate nucleotidylyltransferase/acetyltransferase [Methanobacterium sp. SMA-27]
MKAIILTAGEGTRMRPLTVTKPKTMLQVGGKPILQYNVESLRNAGVSDITMVVGYREEVIKNHFKDGSFLGVKINYVTQEQRLGTAHAIGSTKDTIKGKFIVLNGDIIVDPVLIEDLIQKYNSKSAKSLLVLTEVDDPSSFGVVELNGDKIINIVEKPAPGEAPSNLINAGIYLFDEDIFKAIDLTRISKRGEYEITDSLQIQMDNNEKVLGIKSKNNWIDIGRPWELLDVNEHFLKDMETDIHGEIEEEVTIHGPVFIGKNTIVRSGTYIMGPAHIGENCDIGPNTFIRKYTSIGNNVSVGNAVEIKNSIIMDNTNVNHLTYVGDSIIGSKCNIAAGTNIANLRFDDGNIKIRVKGNKIDSGRRKMGVVFGDGVKTGINSSFNPGVKVGVNSRIGAGAIVSKDLESNKVLIPKQEHNIIDNNR